eukprot:6473618-Amphidinium_carterae.1
MLAICQGRESFLHASHHRTDDPFRPLLLSTGCLPQNEIGAKTFGAKTFGTFGLTKNNATGPEVLAAKHVRANMCCLARSPVCLGAWVLLCLL